jgi:phospholipid/cholesterol/gamma-HCH transport system ATP-binding protein
MNTEPTPNPVLELDGARAAPEAVWADAEAEAELPAIDLRLAPGAAALVEAPERRRGRALAALCAGLPRLAEGHARFLGQDWAALPRRRAEALRGRIGHIFAEDGGWLPHLSVEEGILLPQLHHGSAPEAALRRAAAALAVRFGLEGGLPEGRPAELSSLDLARAACVRAFLGEPMLLLLERPLRRGLWTEVLAGPLLDALAEARGRGAACVWLSERPSAVWDEDGLRAAPRYRLSRHGLRPLGDAAAAPPREAAA